MEACTCILKAPSPRFLPLKLGAHLPKRSSSAGAPRLPREIATPCTPTSRWRSSMEPTEPPSPRTRASSSAAVTRSPSPPNRRSKSTGVVKLSASDVLGEHLHRTQKAIKTVQLCLRSWRRKRLFGNTTIPLVRGPLGLVMFPIYTKALTLEGVQGRGRPYTGNAFGILAPDHRLRLTGCREPRSRRKTRLAGTGAGPPGDVARKACATGAPLSASSRPYPVPKPPQLPGDDISRSEGALERRDGSPMLVFWAPVPRNARRRLFSAFVNFPTIWRF